MPGGLTLRARKGAPLFWSAVLATLTMVAEELELQGAPKPRGQRLESSIGLSDSAVVPRALRTRGVSPPWLASLRLGVRAHDSFARRVLCGSFEKPEVVQGTYAAHGERV